MLEIIVRGLEFLGIKREHQGKFFVAAWVLGMTGHAAWVCGFLAAFGLASPFARAEDVDKLKRAALITARIQLQGEIRAQTKAYCSISDAVTREYILRRIDSLRGELYELTQVNEPSPTCPPAPITQLATTPAGSGAATP